MKNIILLAVILLISVVSCSKDTVKKSVPAKLKGGFAIGEKFSGIFVSTDGQPQSGGFLTLDIRSDGIFVEDSFSGVKSRGTWMIDVGGYLNCLVGEEVVGRYKKESNENILKVPSARSPVSASDGGLYVKFSKQ